MNMNDREHHSILSKIGIIFFVLWIISLASNVLGGYEYKKEFLLASLILWTANSFVEGISKRKAPATKKVARGFRKVGGTSLGFWVLLLILNYLDWLESWWNQYIIYALWIALVFMCAGFLLNAFTSRGKVWKVRSSLYSAGGVVLFSWVVLRVFDMYAASQDTVLVAGIALVAGGFLIGASKKEYDYPFIDEAYAGIQEEMVEVPVYEPSDYVHVLTEPSVIGTDTTVTISKGALFVDIFKDAQQIGTVYFGECRYVVKATDHTHHATAIGMAYGHGSEWTEALFGQASRRAEEEDYTRLGLTEHDIRELGVIFASNDPNAAEKFEDIIKRITDTGTKVSLPFIKVFESTEGDYVKVGPIQVTDIKGKGSKVRIGNRTFVDPENAAYMGEEPQGIAVKIKTPDDTISIAIDDKGVVAGGNEFSAAISPNSESIEVGKVTYWKDSKKRILEAPSVEMAFKRDKKTFKTATFKVTVKNSQITASNAQKHIEMTNESLARLIVDRMDAYFPAIVDEAFSGERGAAEQLADMLSDELDI